MFCKWHALIKLKQQKNTQVCSRKFINVFEDNLRLIRNSLIKLSFDITIGKSYTCSCKSCKLRLNVAWYSQNYYILVTDETNVSDRKVQPNLLLIRSDTESAGRYSRSEIDGASSRGRRRPRINLSRLFGRNKDKVSGADTDTMRTVVTIDDEKVSHCFAMNDKRPFPSSTASFCQ